MKVLRNRGDRLMRVELLPARWHILLQQFYGELVEGEALQCCVVHGSPLSGHNLLDTAFVLLAQHA